MKLIARLIGSCCILLGAAAPAAHAQRSTPFQVLHPAGAASDQFGISVAVYGDTMVVGALNDDVGANSNLGSAHIYRWTGAGWTLEATLTASDGAANDGFGSSVAIWRATVVVGAYSDDIGAIADKGSAYVFVRSGPAGGWTQQAKLTASDGVAGDELGWTVALSGETAVVGRLLGEGGNTDAGSAYIFVRSGGVSWTQQAKLTASDGAPGDEFGIFVAIAGDTAVVGAPGDNAGAGVFQGSAYIFVRPAPGTTWTQQQKLVAFDGATLDNFGNAVAISSGGGGDTVIVGAFADDTGANANQGAAYTFVRPSGGTTWSLEQKLVSSDGAANDFFGVSVALWSGAGGDTAVVGAYNDSVGTSNRGAACIFTRTGGGAWTQQTKLTGPSGSVSDSFGYAAAIWDDTVVVGALTTAVDGNSSQGAAWVFTRVGTPPSWIGPDLKIVASDGTAFDNFGNSVAISSGGGGDTAIVGAYADSVGANANQGSVYIFVRPSAGGAWTQQAKITAPDGAATDLFGYSVAIAGDTAVVGAYVDDIGGNSDQGSAYVLVRSGGTWSVQQKLTAADGAANDTFGNSVAVSGDTVVVGAFSDDTGANANQGSAYVFTRSGTIWSQQQKLVASDGAANDFLGNSVAITPGGGGDTAVVGAPSDDVGANANQGSVYVFTHFPGAGTWTQQQRLTALDGSSGDSFGGPVAIAGDTVVVGAFSDDVGAGPGQGSAYIFTRSGTVWAQQARLVAPDGTSGDAFGGTAGISGATALVGAIFDTVGGITQQGSAYTFDIPSSDLSLAHNDATDVSFPTLGAAILPAQSGQQITVTDGAIRTISNLDTLGRSIGLVGTGDVRTAPGSVLTLGGSSTLSGATGSTMDIYGQLLTSSPGSASVSAGAFYLGTRGMLTVRTGTSLAINAAVSTFEGPARLESGATLSFAGAVTALEPITAFSGATLSAGGTITNIDTFSLTAGTVSAPLLWNREIVNIFGASAVFGSYTNDAGAITTIRGGTLFVFGTLTNNGTIIGTICSNCVGTPPNLDVGASLVLGAGANLTMPFPGSLVHVGGNFDCAIDSNARYDMALATLQMEGGQGEQTLEAMSRDIGGSATGLDRTIAGHYPIKVLEIGPSPSTVRLADAWDNDGLGQGASEAVYVDTLQIDAGSRLMNTSCRVYYNTLVNNGTVDVPANLVHIPPPCPADFNHDGQITPADVAVLVSTWFTSLQQGTLAGDFNGDGLITPVDVAVFVSTWFAALTGGC